MKKLLKKKMVKSICLVLIGIIIGGSIGITANTYLLQSNEIQYTNDKSVQQAIDELFVKAENCGSGEVKDLILTPEILGSNINISYTGNYTDAKCVYGTDEKYGNVGVIDNNMCSIIGTPNITYYYKITTLNNVGEIYSGSGSSKASAGATVMKNNLPPGVKAIIYLDPTNLGATCNEANSIVGGNAKSGCMKWYAFKEDSNSYTMILDHNTTAKVNSWSAASTQLTTDTAGWSGNPRLITGQEIANITGISWTSTGSDTSFRGSSTPSDYYWLYDYTNGCTSYGCKIADDSTDAYWTSTSRDSGSAWCVNRGGFLYYSGVSNTYFGVRPVITISKSSL